MARDSPPCGGNKKTYPWHPSARLWDQSSARTHLYLHPSFPPSFSSWRGGGISGDLVSITTTSSRGKQMLTCQLFPFTKQSPSLCSCPVSVLALLSALFFSPERRNSCHARITDHRRCRGGGIIWQHQWSRGVGKLLWCLWCFGNLPNIPPPPFVSRFSAFTCWTQHVWSLEGLARCSSGRLEWSQWLILTSPAM